MFWNQSVVLLFIARNSFYSISWCDCIITEFLIKSQSYFTFKIRFNVSLKINEFVRSGELSVKPHSFWFCRQNILPNKSWFPFGVKTSKWWLSSGQKELNCKIITQSTMPPRLAQTSGLWGEQSEIEMNISNKKLLYHSFIFSVDAGSHKKVLKGWFNLIHFKHRYEFLV